MPHTQQFTLFRVKIPSSISASMITKSAYLHGLDATEQAFAVGNQ